MRDNFVHKKSLGQNFLNSDVVPRWMCDATDLAAEERVLEIGPGAGALTREILARGCQVIAVEADTRAIDTLEETFAAELASGQLRLNHQDARTLDVTQLGLTDHQFKVVANIPYYLTGYLFRTLLESHCQPTDLVFLTQKEVAERIARDPKESLLSLSVKAFGTPQYVRTVPRGHFTPAPAVASAIVAVRNVSRDNFQATDMALFFKLIHLGFGQKRKQLLGNLAAKFDREVLHSMFQQLAVPPTIRAEDVSLETWLALTSALEKEPAETEAD